MAVLEKRDWRKGDRDWMVLSKLKNARKDSQIKLFKLDKLAIDEVYSQ